jgi:GAF domain-containing protein
VLINNVVASELLTAQERAAALDQGAAALAGFPLSSHTRRLGMLSIADHEAHIFTPEEVRAAQTLAGQIAAHLENHDLLEATREQARRMEQLNAFTGALSVALDTVAVYRVVSEQIPQLFEADRASIAIKNADDKTFHIAALQETSAAALSVGQGLPIMGTAVGQVLRSGHPALRHNIVISPFLDEKALLSQGIRSAAIAPMIAGGRTLGALSLGSREANRFTEQDLALLAQAASQVAIALDNARLFDEARQRARNEETINRIAAQLQEHASMEAMLQLALRELGQTLGARRARVSLTMQGDDGS